MQPVKLLDKGERFTAYGCRLEKLTCYTGKVLGEDATRWRHVFRAPTGDVLVYTGAKVIAGKEGNRYDIRATVKGQEPQWKMTRISRPVATPTDTRQLALTIKP